MQLMLKALREEKHMSQSELAAAIGTTMRKVSSWETMEVRIPLMEAARIADVLDCTLDELAGREYHPTGSFADPRQAELNRCWQRLDTERQDRLIGTAQDMEAAKRVKADPHVSRSEAV